MPGTAPRSEPKRAGLRWQPLWLLAVWLVALWALEAQDLARAWWVNQAAVAMVRGWFSSKVSLGEAQALLASPFLADDCRALWLQGLVAHAQGREAGRDDAWTRWLQCPQARVAFVEAVTGDDISWAERSVRLAPQDAEGWFWLARLRADSDPDGAIALYRQGFARNPVDALRWRELGDLLAGRDPGGAILAYLNSCYYGDPGSNGCYRAGKTAERLGDWGRAAQYYRLSRNEEVRRLAVEMEKRLQGQESR